MQKKINHWAEMALLINDEFAPSPEGFGYLVKENTLVCGFIDGFDSDRGDALTPSGEMPVFSTMAMNFSGNTTAADVYRYIQQAVEYANDRWHAINEEKSPWV